MVSYIDKRHCRNEETIETRCDELARYNARGSRTSISGGCRNEETIETRCDKLARYNACGSRASHDIFFDWMTSERGMI